MANLAERLKRTVLRGRGIAGTLGFRPYRVYFSTEFYTTGSFAGISTVELTEGNGQPPRVKTRRDQDIPIGAQAPDVLTVGPVTPVGATLEILTDWFQPVTDGETRHLILIGPGMANGKRYRVVKIDTDRALGWKIDIQSDAELLQGFGG
jgi:hypothetical protein